MTSAPTRPTSDTAPQQTAAALCAAGKFAEALALVQPTLDSALDAPAHELAQALNVAAVCSLGLDRVADAEGHWRRAISATPDFADAYNNLGILLMKLKRPLEAEAVYRQLIAIHADHADAHNNLGAVLYDLRRLPEAEAAYRRAAGLRPGFAQVHYNLGIVLHDLGRLGDAEAAYRQALADRPDYAEAYNNLGNVLKDAGRLAEAASAYERAVATRPRYPDALNNLGSTLLAFNRLVEAELAVRLALSLRPAYAEAHNNLGAVLNELKRLPEAEAAYRQALAVRPDYAEAHYNLGIVLRTLDRLPEAEAAYRESLRIRPDGVEALNNLGSVLQALEREHEAAAVYRQALDIRPAFAEAHQNLANVLKELGDLPAADVSYRRALEIRPDYGDAKFGLATLCLKSGRFEEGWALYESRYDQPGFIHSRSRAALRCPQWQGGPLAGKSLLVWQEDGLGDMVQFGRYFALLKAQGAARIEFACVQPLRRLFEGVEGIDAVTDHDAALARASEYDCWTSLLSAPLRLGTTLATIPPAVYLTPEPALVEHWRSRLAVLPAGRRIGLVWRGNPRHHNDANRSLPSLAALTPLWSVPGVSFVSLQKGQGEDEARFPPANLPLLHLGSDVEDFADTAAIVAQLDLVICVDTSTAHLAASLGKPCWVLLPARDVDWRWMNARDDSPWYPETIRLFRRQPSETWLGVVERVRLACAEGVSGGDGVGALARASDGV